MAAIVRERAPGVPLTLSSELLPEVREFERTSTTVTNAYVLPVMSRTSAASRRSSAGSASARRSW